MANHHEKENRIEKILRRLIAFVVIMAFMTPFLTPQVFASSTLTISGGDRVEGGDTFIVSVIFGGGNVGRVDAQLTYDTSKLTYVSGGSSSGNTGYIQLKNAGVEGSVTFNIEFQAIADGETTIEVTTNEIYDLDEMMMDAPSGSKGILIAGNAEEEEKITEPSEESGDEMTETTTQLQGVDEKTEEIQEPDEASGSLTAVLIGIAAVLVVLIVIISIVLNRKRSR